MFSNGSKTGRDAGVAPAAQPGNGKRGVFSVVGPDVTITGNVAATADLHVDGRIDGDVDCGNLVQGTESVIAGSVRAETARLAGTIEGAVSGRQLTIERSARIAGDIQYESISIENGASIDGRLKHVSASAASRAPAATTSRLQAQPEEQMRLISPSDVAA
ncbi:bactofilin family protein [Sphingomonas sp. GB1N7]|uniref:bactofilin family protein n=1 Tax=Parasphingomonas caseinilytica TaxID=3096158 RepID=UPI002FCA0C30